MKRSKSVAAIAAAALTCAALATAQQPLPKNEPVRRPAQRPRVIPQVVNPAVQAERRRARELLQLFFREGQKKPFVAQQTTRILSGMVRESQLIVKHAGPGREKMEFLSPANMKGEVILQTGGHILNYKPAEQRIFEGVAPLELLEMRTKEFMQDLRAGKVTLRLIGTEIVADQNAAILEIRGGNGGKRLWIDEKTGVRLRTDELNAAGSVIQTSYFTKVDYTPIFDPAEFLPRTLPRVPHDAQFPTHPPLPNVAAAQQQVSYPIREPSLPEGCRLTGVWVVELAPKREVTILRYTDGVTTFALFQQPLDPRALLNNANKPAAPVRVNRTNGAIHWVSGDRHFTLLGNVRPAAAQQIIKSLQ